MNKGMGLRKDSYKVLDYCGAFRQTSVDDSKLPNMFILAKEHIPDVRDQGTVGSCVGFSTTNVMQILNYKETGERDRFAAGYVYGKCRDKEDTYVGMYIRSMLDYLIKTGAPFEELFPFNEEMPKIRKMVEDRPDLDEKAEPYHIAGYEVYAQGDKRLKWQAVKNALYQYNQPILAATDFPGGSHAICIIGWDDTKEQWIILNSWGEDYGDNGIGRIRYEQLDRGYLLVDAKNKDLLMPFTDIGNENERWYYHAIKKAYNAGFMNGVSSTTFEPERNITRAEVAQVMVNSMEKQDDVNERLSLEIQKIKEKLKIYD